MKDENYLTTNSNKSNDAIEKFHDINPDLIILDVWLDGSELDGIKLLKYFNSVQETLFLYIEYLLRKQSSIRSIYLI